MIQSISSVKKHLFFLSNQVLSCSRFSMTMKNKKNREWGRGGGSSLLWISQLKCSEMQCQCQLASGTQRGSPVPSVLLCDISEKMGKTHCPIQHAKSWGTCLTIFLPLILLVSTTSLIYHFLCKHPLPMLASLSAPLLYHFAPDSDIIFYSEYSIISINCLTWSNVWCTFLWQQLTYVNLTKFYFDFVHTLTNF